jgi:hypothetical protein
MLVYCGNFDLISSNEENARQILQCLSAHHHHDIRASLIVSLGTV